MAVFGRSLYHGGVRVLITVTASSILIRAAVELVFCSIVRRSRVIIGWIRMLSTSIIVIVRIAVLLFFIFLLIVSPLLFFLGVGDVSRFLFSSDLLLTEHLNVSVQCVQQLERYKVARRHCQVNFIILVSVREDIRRIYRPQLMKSAEHAPTRRRQLRNVCRMLYAVSRAHWTNTGSSGGDFSITGS